MKSKSFLLACLLLISVLVIAWAVPEATQAKEEEAREVDASLRHGWGGGGHKGWGGHGGKGRGGGGRGGGWVGSGGAEEDVHDVDAVIDRSHGGGKGGGKGGGGKGGGKGGKGGWGGGGGKGGGGK